MREHVRERVRLPAGRVLVVGGGKATGAMALGVEDALGPDGCEGVVVLPPGVRGPSWIQAIRGGHPTPDEGSVAGARAILDVLADAGEDDLVIGLISGGASALLACPAPGTSLAELQARTTALLASGVPIERVNAERGRWSATAAGGLARAAEPARVEVLVVSDVVGDHVDVIGSAPFLGAPHEVVLSNEHALGGATEAARALGYETVEVTRSLTGEAREVGQRIARRILAERGDDPCCLLWGGETTVTVAGDGLGGRNQELALAGAQILLGEPDVVLLSAGTDGVDGPTDAAGAVVDGTTAERTDVAAALAANDSHRACEAAGALVRTGPTGVNVMDLVVGLVA